jgi:hypothetical protein
MEDDTYVKRQKREADPVADSVDLTQSDEEPGLVQEKEDDPNPGSDEEKTLPELQQPPPPPSWIQTTALMRSHSVSLEGLRIPIWYVRHKFGRAGERDRNP